MTWEQTHARHDIMDTVLARAAELGAADPAVFGDLPRLGELFGGLDGLIAALQYRWDNHSAAQAEAVQDGNISMWEATATIRAHHGTLRAVLDAWTPAGQRLTREMLVLAA